MAKEETMFGEVLAETIIERVAEPLGGGRAQLMETVFVNGVKVLALSHKVGSPAPIATVRQHEETFLTYLKETK